MPQNSKAIPREHDYKHKTQEGRRGGTGVPQWTTRTKFPITVLSHSLKDTESLNLQDIQKRPKWKFGNTANNCQKVQHKQKTMGCSSKSRPKNLMPEPGIRWGQNLHMAELRDSINRRIVLKIWETVAWSLKVAQCPGGVSVNRKGGTWSLRPWAWIKGLSEPPKRL